MRIAWLSQIVEIAELDVSDAEITTYNACENEKDAEGHVHETVAELQFQ